MLILLATTVVACSPQEIDDYSLGDLSTITDDMVSFTKAPSAESANKITFTNTSNLPAGVYTYRWDLGNGASSNKETVEGMYPFAGDYTVTLSIHTTTGAVVSKSEVITITNDDYTLVNTPVYNNLTGGADNTEGKTWVFDQYNNFTKEVASETGLDIRGHMGLGPIEGGYSQEWWGAAPNDKSDWDMYSTKFTFIQNGVKLIVTKDGDEGYGRAKTAESVGGFDVIRLSGEDAIFKYSGGNYTFSLDESGEYPKLTLSGNGFMGYYAGTQEYDIIYQTDKVMALAAKNPAEGQVWVFVYTLEEYNVEAPEAPKEPKAMPLEETFEGEEPMVAFETQDMGDAKMSGVIDNPVPLPINESAKVYRYWKSTEFYSNLSFTAEDYKFDLTKQNKIKVKVFIPSFNDYTTENEVAGEWIANNKLLPQLAVKLQDSESAEPWNGQAEIIKGNLELDKWIELEFDFSGFADREDYDKIVIQFGGEGHTGSGFFYLDDFTFSE